jgi:protein-tyrosine phosphatase
MRWNGSLKKPLALGGSGSGAKTGPTPSPPLPEGPKESKPRTKSALGPGLKLSKWPGHEVHPGVYVGDLSCALDLGQLRQRKITHVLTATNRMKPMFPDDIHYLVLDFPDSADQNLLDVFAEAHAFIGEAHAGSGAVLIHCMAGQSRSVSVALSYIMAREGVSDTEALAALRAHRSDAKPIAAFQEQLALFHRMQCRVDDAHPEVQKLRRSTNKIPLARSKPPSP